MGNPFTFFISKDPATHRLTDIETEEVSLVDKGANKRKFAVIKRDLEAIKMSRGPEMFEDINKADATTVATVESATTSTTSVVDEKASAILESMTTGLEQLASLTELVKAHVEKAEAVTPEAVQTWQTAMTDVTAWAEKTMKAHFITKSEPVAETVVVPVETPAEEKPAEIVAAPEAEVAKTETPAEEPVVTKTPAEILADVQTTILDLASTVPTVSTVKAALAKMDGLYVSGGLYVDAYDIEALAKVCNALCDAMCDPNAEDSAAMKKAADKILGEISKRTATVVKRVTKSTTTNEADGKELKIVALMLKALENGLDATEEVTPVIAPAAAVVTQTVTVDPAATQKLVDEAVTKAIAAAVPAAVNTAVVELNKKNAELEAQVATLKTEKAEVNKKLTAAMSETQTRGSSPETVVKNEPGASMFPMDYNAKSFDELNK